MKRKNRWLALCLAAALLATGCGGTEQSQGKVQQGTENGTAVAGETTELTLWLTPQWKGVFDGNEDGADYDSFFKEAAKRYQENVNPNVSVKVEVIDGSTRDENLSVAQQTNTLPNIVFEGAFTMSSFYHKGAIVPLNDIHHSDTLAIVSIKC